jgi:flagellar hook-basal body complex protein FliE
MATNGLGGLGGALGLNKISSLNTLSNMIKPQNNEKELEVNKSKSFGEYLNEAIAEVNDDQLKAYDAMEGIATGKVENLQEAVTKIEEAELSLKLALEVKNKALSSYKEIMRMQI